MYRLIIYTFYLLCISCSSSDLRSSVDLKKVNNIGEVGFSTEASRALEKNGFIFTETDEKDIYDVYSKLKKDQRPIFITTDIILHTDHLLFDYILRIIEIEKLNNLVSQISKDMLKEMVRNYSNKKFSFNEKEALERDIGFFAVACRLFQMHIQIPKVVDKKVEEELRLIDDAEGFVKSPLFSIKEDYSQYKPRGHYTRNETFRKYFKVMMWYGRMPFFLKAPKSNINIEKQEEIAKSLTLSALYITYILQNNPFLMESYDTIYRITALFVGKSDDLGVKDYLSIMDEVYGKNADIKLLSDNDLLRKFMKSAGEKKLPKIVSGLLTDKETTELPRSFKFFGQRFIPDSYIFQNLVYDKVTNFTGKGMVFTAIPSQIGMVRGFPRGLDVMAVLGSDEALEILEKEGDTSFKGYKEQLVKLKKEFSQLTESDWRKNLYYRIIYQFKEMIANIDEFKNPYIDRKNWARKVLNTLLGAWAELRHDTILYAKQSYTIMVTSLRPHIPKKQPPVYVEAYPHFYSENLEFIKVMREMFEKENAVPEKVIENLRSFEDILRDLTEVSIKENRMQRLDNEVVKDLYSIPARLEDIVKFPTQIMKKITDGADSKMALIADVHTDVNTKQVLEEGVGNPLKIFIVVPVNNKPYLMEGGTFSYYEFKEKMSNRLTDEQWQKKIKEKNLPPLQKWFKELVK